MSYYITYACLTPISSLAARSPCFWRGKRTGAKKKITHDTQKNRSSSTNPFANLTDIGGVNSIRQFSRSWQRAAVFHEVIPQRPSFAFAPDQEPVQHATAAAEPNHQYARGDVEAGPRASLLRERLEAHDVSENAIGEGDDNDEGGNGAAAADPASSHLAAGDDHLHEAKRQRSGSDLFRVFSSSAAGGSILSGRQHERRNSIFEVPPHLATPDIVGSWGTYRSYGTTLESDDGVSRSSMAHAADLWRQQQETGVNVPDGQRPPILVKEVEQEGRIVLAVSGQSTLPQTIMNATK